MGVCHQSRKKVAIAVSALLAGCAATGDGAQPLSLPSLPSVGSLQPSVVEGPSAPVTINQPLGSATELYSRLARGAMSCWFAPGGPLKKDYIYHATADAPSRGGKAQIVIHSRDPALPNPRGAKAFLIDIEPKGESAASITAENLKMPAAFATAMTDDIARWSKGDQGCAAASTAVGWAPAPQQAQTVATETKAKGKSVKGKAKPAQPKPASP